MHYFQCYRMAISRDNAEIVAKGIQISLNLFERPEHVLKTEVFRHFSVSSLYVNALENSFFVRVHVSNGGHSKDTESPGASLCARKSKTAEACGVKK